MLTNTQGDKMSSFTRTHTGAIQWVVMLVTLLCMCVCVREKDRELGKRSRLVTVRSLSYGPDQPPWRSEVTGSGVELSKPITGQRGLEGLSM